MAWRFLVVLGRVITDAKHRDRFGFDSPPRCAPQGETRESPTKW